LWITFKNNLSVARIENVTKSPLFSHIAASVQGLSTIKAYKKENDFIERWVIFKI